jgi:hypothetical protein
VVLTQSSTEIVAISTRCVVDYVFTVHSDTIRPDYADAVVWEFGRQGKPENVNLKDFSGKRVSTTSTREMMNRREQRQKTRQHLHRVKVIRSVMA